MELLIDYTNVRGLYRIIANIPDETSRIHASIAYNTSDTLLKKVISRRIEFIWWGLFDSENSTRHDLIKLALNNKDLIQFHPVKQNFHPKLIYFENYGLYVGSANMTKKALQENIEAGVFLTQSDLLERNLISELEDYFTALEKFPVITDEDAKRYLDYIESNPDLKRTRDFEREKREKEFNDLFKHLPFNDSAVVLDADKKYNRDRINNRFIVEWRSTTNILQSIMTNFSDSRYYPEWIIGEPPRGIMADQLLHAFYYSIVMAEKEDESSYQICQTKHEINKDRKEDALKEVLEWWKNLASAPSKEDINIHKWTPINLKYLKKDKITKLTVEELTECYLHNHAARNHARQMTKETLGFPPGTKSTIEECTVAFAKYHYKLRNKKRMTILELLNYVIYDEQEAIEVRISKALSKELYIPHVGKSLLGEFIGWARPDDYPIRNNRVNKALFALGYNVKLFNK